MNRKTVLFWFLSVYLFCVTHCLSGENTHLLFGFEENTEIWSITKTENNAVKKISLSTEKAITGKQSLKVALNFPGEGCIEKDFFKDLTIYNNLVLNVYLPATAPDDLQISVLLQDNELLWYQTQRFSLTRGIWNRLTLDVKPGSAFWESIGHQQPWSEKPASGIRKITIKLFSEHHMSVDVYLDDISGNLFAFPDFTFNNSDIKVYEKFEISFNLSRKIKNPFDTDEIKVEGVFTCPDGEILVRPGFYYQKYARKLLENGEEKLTPEGYPYWKIRFTPETTGIYKYYLKIQHNQEVLCSKENQFTAWPSEQPGFVKTSSIDWRYFVFSNGVFFYPLGLNVRSPTDTRYASLMKKKLEPDAGTFYYEEVFKKMSENGINFVEVWLAPWFAALEWKENRPGYRGLEYYNLRNGFKLDSILEFAEKNGIFIQLVIINHGQLSTWCDQEWQDNPYNTTNQGFLKTPEEFFTDTKAKHLFKKQLYYIVGRWGYSPHIFSWEIINEINLIGSKNNFYRNEEKLISAWYREMADYLREIDVFHHLVTAHYTILAKSSILSETVDYTITNGYYNLKNESLFTLLDNIWNHHSKFQKPVFVSEFGGTSAGSSPENLTRDLIAGLWYSYHKPFAAAPLFWWHRFIKERELFGIYNVFSEYISGQDRIIDCFEPEKAEIEGTGKKQICAVAIGTDYFSSCWVYNFAVTKDVENLSLPSMENIEISIRNKKEGIYKVSFYDMEQGMIGNNTISTNTGILKVKLPPFARWIAFKAEFYEQK